MIDNMNLYGYADKTQKSYLYAVRSLAKYYKHSPDNINEEELRRILLSVHTITYQICLKVIYSCGLRLSEGTHLKVKDIDGERNLLKVNSRKGKKDRFVPLPERTLELLRAYWKAESPSRWLFPSSSLKKPICSTTLQKASIGCFCLFVLRFPNRFLNFYLAEVLEIR